MTRFLWRQAETREGAWKNPSDVNYGMRLLAISDIHNLVPSVQELRAREANEFDAVLVAGDMGSKATQQIFDILSTFNCPVLYIRGNWDYQFDISTNFGPNCFHIHNEPFAIGDWHVIGFDFHGLDRAEVAAKIQKLDPPKSIVVSHFRLSRTSQDFAEVPLFLYGHNHRYEDKTYMGSRFVNVSALGEIVTVQPEGGKSRGHSHFRNAIIGAYVTIEIDHGIVITPHSFHQDTSGWVPLFKSIWSDKPLLDTPFKSGRSPIKYPNPTSI